MKYSFKDDYSEGCHSSILEILLQTNLEQTINSNYGLDRFSQEAKKLIHGKLENPKSQIHFVSGGTQANLIVISTYLKPYEAVISADSGHIAVHETGAIEATGHKVITITSENGKLYPNHIQKVLDNHQDEHMVLPKMVYISNATELGTVYTRQELTNLYAFCRQNGLLLFMDGARLGMALASDKSDLTRKDLASNTDIFYIGGTKNGALLGEAIVINRQDLQANFRFAIKQKGGLMAKGRVLGIQFLGLFKDDLFLELGKQANQKAQLLYTGLMKKGIPFKSELESNQIFPIFSKELITRLKHDYSFHIWEPWDDNNDVVRLVTSWATREDMIQSFLNDVETFYEEK